MKTKSKSLSNKLLKLAKETNNLEKAAAMIEFDKSAKTIERYFKGDVRNIEFANALIQFITERRNLKTENNGTATKN